ATGPAVQRLAPIEGAWWRLYDDPVLDGLVADALAANTDIRVAVARLAKARAALREVKVDRLPDVGANAAFSDGRLDEAGQQPGDSRTDTSFDVGLGISYEVDLFGRVSRNVEASRGDLYAAEADADAVRVAV